MKKKLTKRKQGRVSVHSGQVEFVKVNVGGWQWRDVYQWLLALRWPQFAALVGAFYITLNLLFATLYAVDPNSMIEIMSGIFLLAVVTGIIFVRFSRPVARIAFSRSIVIGPLNGQPTLMVRVGNQHQHSIVDTEFRIMFMRDEPLVEGGDFRYFYTLKLHFDKLILFPAALTLRHVIDKSSPLHGATLESLEASRSLFAVSVSGIDPIIAGPVQAQHDYSWRDVRFGERFIDIYTQSGRGQLTVDYGRLHETEAAE